jgi:hypothetical protein
MKISIIGAGMAGLLAANMLRRHQVTVLEKATSLPHNHTALLRFRSPAVSDATGIPFDKVRVRKGLWDGSTIVNEPTLAHSNKYSRIVTGELHDRSILNLNTEDRYIAPLDFVEQLAKNLDIQFGNDVSRPRKEHPVISTVPMPLMMDWVKWDRKPEFHYRPIWTIKAILVEPVSFVHQTIYNTQDKEWYRATLHDSELTLEFSFDPALSTHQPLDWARDAVYRFFGESIMNERVTVARKITLENVNINHQKFGKIMPIDDRLRKEFMLYLTDHWKIYSLGRFATWRAILLDDVVQDVKRIESMMLHGTNYERRLHVTA